MFGRNIRHISINQASNSQTINVDNLKELGFTAKTKTTVGVNFEYDKDKHASLREAWRKKLFNRMDDYGIYDMAVDKLIINLDNPELAESIQEIVEKHKGYWYPNKWKKLRDAEKFVGIFNARKREEKEVKEEIKSHDRNRELISNYGFKCITLNLDRLLTREDFLTEHWKRRCYFVDWLPSDFRKKRSPEVICAGIKRNIILRDKHNNRYGYLNHFKTDEHENLVFAGGE